MQNRCSIRENLNVIVQQFITEYFLNNETDAEQANQIARAELYRGDYRLAGQFVDQLRAVTPEQIRDASHGSTCSGYALRVRRRLDQGLQAR